MINNNSKFKSGDKVVIIPLPYHDEEVRKHYNQIFVVKATMFDSLNNSWLYKVGNIPGYASDFDIELF